MARAKKNTAAARAASFDGPEPEIKAVPPDIADLKKEDASEEDKKLAEHLQACMELAAAGPGAMHRRGVSVPSKPWVPPERVKFEHPVHGELEVAIADGKIEKK